MQRHCCKVQRSPEGRARYRKNNLRTMQMKVKTELLREDLDQTQEGGVKPPLHAQRLEGRVEIGDGLDYPVLLGVGEFGVDGKREHFPAGFFGLGKIAGGVAEMGECLLQVDAEGIEDFRRNASRVEKCFQIIAAGRANGELIVDVFELRGRARRGGDERGKPGYFEEATIAVGAVLPSQLPGIEMAQLYAQNGGLQRMQAAVGADHFVEIFFLAAMDTQHLKTLGNRGVVGGKHAAITCASQIFRREKAEAAIITKSAREAAGVARADRLRGVFNDDEIARVRDGHDGV